MVERPSVILRRHGLRPKKSWGQNFLGDPAILERIAAAAQLAPGDPVVELGAGLGHLTRALLATGARVTAVERDRELAEVLRRELDGESRLTILEANAATLRLEEVSAAPLVVVGNLPYQLSSAILFGMLEQRAHLRRLVFLLQAEFVERLAAGPGTRDYGVLSVQAQAVADVTQMFRVPAAAFHPAPAVDSAVAVLTPLPAPRVPGAGTPHFTRVVRGAFQQRRKTLANALTGAGFKGAREALESVGIDPTRRAETLSIEDFGHLAGALPEPSR